MAERYIYEQIQNPSRKTSGFGKILDTQQPAGWQQEVITIHDKKKATLITESLNLHNELSKLKKRASKKDIIEILNKHNISI